MLVVQNITNFVILGIQRTGTTLVRTSLSSHKDIFCCGEVFNLGGKPYTKPDGYWSYSRQNLKTRSKAMLAPRKATASYLDQLYATTGYSAIGFKFMLSDCLARPYIWAQLLEKEIKAVFVRRSNSLKTLVSRRSSSQFGIYHVSKTLNVKTAVEKWSAPRIEIDTSTLINDLDAINAEYTKWESRLNKNVEYIDIVYEQYSADMKAGNERILDFLGVQQKTLSSDLKKINPDNLGEIIINYDEVVKVLKETAHAQYLDVS